MGRSRREELVDAAARVFAREGFHSTGIDRLLSEAGVAKMTLYNHFKSKDELIAAALERASESHFAEIRAALSGVGAERVMSYFDALRAWFASPGFSGCVMLNAAAEFKDGEHPVRRVVRAHAARQLALLEDLAAGAGARDARAMGESLQILAEGAIEVAKVTGDWGCAERAKSAAKVLLAAGVSVGG